MRGTADTTKPGIDPRQAWLRCFSSVDENFGSAVPPRAGTSGG